MRALVGVVGKQRFGAIVGMGAVKREATTVVMGAEVQHTSANSNSCNNNKYNNNTPTNWLVKFTKRSY